MNNTWKVVVAAVALAGTTSAAKADLTLDGQTGLFANPTAEIVSKGAPEIAGSFTRYSDRGFHEKQYTLHGAIHAADRLELSAGYEHYSDNEDYSENDWHVGGKYQLLSRQDKGFDLAVGVDYLRYNGDFDNHGNYYLAYLAATKALTNSEGRAPVKGTLGVRWDKDDPNGSDGSSKVSVYAGLEVPITRSGQFSLIGELGSKRFEDSFRDSDAAWDIGVRYHPKDSGVSLGAGYGNPWGWKGSSTWFAQVGYQFGK